MAQVSDLSKTASIDIAQSMSEMECLRRILWIVNQIPNAVFSNIKVTTSIDTTGLATSTGQNTGNASLAEIDANTNDSSDYLFSIDQKTILPTTGNGATDASTMRVTLSNDSTGQVKLATGANTIGALAANQSVNMSQVNGHTTVEGGQNGVQAVGGVVATNTVVSSAGNPIPIAGSDYAGTPRIQTAKIDSSGLQYVLATGAAAQGASVTGNPLLHAGVARQALGTKVSDGQVATLALDAYGRTQIVKPKLTQASSNGTAITTNTNTTLVAAPSANTHIRVHRIHVTNSSATATFIYFCDGTPGTKLWPHYLQQGAVVSIPIDGTWDLTGGGTPTALVANTATTACNIEWHIVYEIVAD